MYCIFEQGPLTLEDFAAVLGGRLKSYNSSSRSWWVMDMEGITPTIVQEVRQENKMGLALGGGGKQSLLRL